MSRYYSDSDDEYSNHRRRSESVRGSGWQSPLPKSTTNIAPSPSSSSVTRIVVESPFGSKKCDYSIDKSQRGRLIITARRRQNLSSDYRPSNDKKHIAVQTFTIPDDADVDHLQSHTERGTNRLIIEIPRQQRTNYRTSRSSYINTTDARNSLIRSPDVERMLTSPTGGPKLVRDDTKSNKKNSGNNRKLEYRIDCRGYTADELDVFIQGRDLMVQGKTHTSKSPDPNHQRVSKKFTRKITLPSTVDIAKVVSYLEHGELRIEAPIKRGVYYSDEEIIIPGPPPPSTSNRATAALISNLENRVRSPPPSTSNRSTAALISNFENRVRSPPPPPPSTSHRTASARISNLENRVRSPPPASTSNRTATALISSFENRVRSPSPNDRRHYQRNERVGRRRDYDRADNRRVSSPMRRVRSVEGLRYPLYVSPRELDEDDEDKDDTKERDSRRRRTANYERHSVDRKETEQKPIYRSVYSPTSNVVTTATTSTMGRHHNYPSDDDNYLRF